MLQLRSISHLAITDRWSIGAVLALLIYPCWVWSGGYPPLAWPMGVLAAGGGFVLIITMFLSTPDDGAREARRQLARDPLLYTGGIFCLLLLIRWANAWWPQRMDAAAAAIWFSGQPRISWLPAAVTAEEAGVLAFGWASALVAALLIRHGMRERRSLRILFALLTGQAALLALFGMVQFASGTSAIYWTVPRTRPFFASFFYENHAGQFFYLMLAVALGSILHRVCAQSQPPARGQRILDILVLALLFMACLFSLSRTAIVVGIVFLGLGAGYLVRHAPSYLTPLHRLYLLTAFAAVGLLGLVLVSGRLGTGIREDFSRSRPGQTLVEQALEARLWQWQTAARIWQHHPMWGVGSFGFRYYLPFYAPAEQLDQLDQDHVGQAHNDPLTTLCEQGTAGFLPWLATLGLLSAPGLRTGLRRRDILRFPSLGLAMILVHSLFDLPFLNPAVLIAWCVVAAATGRYIDLLDDQPATPRRG